MNTATLKTNNSAIKANNEGEEHKPEYENRHH